MADSHTIRLFDSWTEVDSDYQYILRVMEELGFQCDYADLSLSEQQLVLTAATAKKRAWRMHLIGRA